ncbi:ATP-binding protein [Kineosporia sp. A_224]|uniref:ATP-binding protein n=1 Tax=Kineosporia sp. A_224 TaxID=1962180 RepID=UPI000B4B4AA2|nr:ATP-binding protein [Kineosporia sp. A_224]
MTATTPRPPAARVPDVTRYADPLDLTDLEVDLSAPDDAHREATDTTDAEGAEGAAAAPEDTGRGGRGPSQASQLRALALARYTLCVSEDGSPFAVPRVGPQVVRMLRSGRTGLRAELAREYARAHGGAVPSSSALADALMALEGEAAETDPRPLALRAAAHGDGLALDLGRADGHAVTITAAGWDIVDRSPVLFRRTALTGPLPNPVRGGTLTPLRSRLNVPDEDWPLVLAWLVTALMPDLPHPLLLLMGEQGTGKSSATRLLVNVLDPGPAPLRTAPSDVEGWSVAAAASWVVGLDNLSGLQPWLSDALCRAVTGDGLVRRALYSNDDVSVLTFRRVVANGIDLGALRGDLADRMVAVNLHRIPDTERRPDGAVHMDDDERAAVLGALLDLAARVLDELPRVVLPAMPRMADFARVLAAVDTVAGTSGLDDYLRQTSDLASIVVESDPFADAVVTLIRSMSPAEWSGDGGTLLGLLPVPEPRPRKWPTDPAGVSAALRRVAPALRSAAGLVVDDMKHPRTRRTVWTIADSQITQASEPSHPSRTSDDLLTCINSAKPARPEASPLDG